MTERMEMEKKDLNVDPQIEVDDDNPQQINFILDTWFEVDKKFNISTNGEEGTWLNLWGFYNPFEDTLKLKGQISYDDGSSDWFDYEPTKTETETIKEMLTLCIRRWHDQTPQEFCTPYMDEPEMTPTQGGPT